MSIKDVISDTNDTDNTRRIIERNDIALCEGKINDLFWKLNRELRKRLKRQVPRDFKVDLYVVGGACVVTTLHSRESTTDIDALWQNSSVVQDAINAVGDSNGLGHTWCNSDFKRTTSYTNKILLHSKLYREMDRLRVYMAKPKLLLAMKLISFRVTKPQDIEDAKELVQYLRNNGTDVTSAYLYGLVTKFYGNCDKLSDVSRLFIDNI